jgi:basic amino acid/polyamine antiporter, APA family
MTSAGSATTESSGRLLRVLGIGFGLAVIVGNCIGAGILRTPGTVAANLPTFWPFIGVWIAGAVYALLGANALSEVGTMLPQSGGQYVFVRHALGRYPGFVVGWSDWLSTCGTTAAVAIVIGEYATVLIPGAPRQTALMIAITSIVLFGLVQWLGVRSGRNMQNATSALKALAFVILIAACFLIGNHKITSSALVLDTGRSQLLAFVLALQAVIYTYDGWTAVIYFSEEVTEPRRDIPRSMIGGVLLVATIYILVNIAFIRVVPIATIAGEKLAAGVVAQEMFGPLGDTVLRVLTILSMLSALNSNQMMAPRVLFAMARDRLVSRWMTRVNDKGTPTMAVLLSSVMAVVFVIGGGFDDVIAWLSFFFVANYTLSFLSVFVLRAREPDTPRPYRAWGHPFTTLLALAGSVAFLVASIAGDPHNALSAMVLLAMSVPAFFLVRIALADLPQEP